MLYFQMKKVPHLIDLKIWRLMPYLVVGLLTLSTIVFLLLATIGPLIDWVEQWNGLLYVAMIYFVLLFYLFIIAMVHKWSKTKDNVIHYAYLWTVGLLLIVTFVV